MTEPPTYDDLLAIVVKLENRVHQTRMALFGTMKALSTFAQEAAPNEESYNKVKAAILDAAAEFKTKDSDES